MTLLQDLRYALRGFSRNRVASYLPARRAARTDPMASLRAE